MFVYILYSDSLHQYYVGVTADIQDRLIRHNQGRSRSTKYGIPWLLVKTIEVESRSEAMRLEKKIKGRGIKRWLEGHDESRPA